MNYLLKYLMRYNCFIYCNLLHKTFMFGLHTLYESLLSYPSIVSYIINMNFSNSSFKALFH